MPHKSKNSKQDEEDGLYSPITNRKTSLADELEDELETSPQPMKDRTPTADTLKLPKEHRRSPNSRGRSRASKTSEISSTDGGSSRQSSLGGASSRPMSPPYPTTSSITFDGHTKPIAPHETLPQQTANRSSSSSIIRPKPTRQVYNADEPSGIPSYARGEFRFSDTTLRLQEMTLKAQLIRAQMCLLTNDTQKAIEHSTRAGELASTKLQHEALAARCACWRGRAELRAGNAHEAVAALKEGRGAKGFSWEGKWVEEDLARARGGRRGKARGAVDRDGVVSPMDVRSRGGLETDASSAGTVSECDDGGRTPASATATEKVDAWFSKRPGTSFSGHSRNQSGQLPGRLDLSRLGPRSSVSHALGDLGGRFVEVDLEGDEDEGEVTAKPVLAVGEGKGSE